MASSPLDQHEFFSAIKRLRKESRVDGMLRLISDAVRRGSLDALAIEQAGRMARRELESAERGDLLEVSVLGQCTTSWISNALVAQGLGQGLLLRVRDGEYDNVRQELLTSRQEDKPPAAIVLVPWNQRLLGEGGDGTAESRIEDEVKFWRRAWEVVGECGARVIQVGYDYMTCGALGTNLGGAADGALGLVREVNRRLRRELPQGDFFIDLEYLAGEFGRSRFYDPRRYFWTKQPFSEAGAALLAGAIASGMRTVRVGPKKVLVLDLDNTLWGGVVGEVGPLGVALSESPEGEAFRAFQNRVKQLAKRGVVLAIASKNNEADALEVFHSNPEMVLKLTDFAATAICWNPKADGLLAMAETLQLGLDSFVFFDDNPAEREQIRQALPEVTVLEVPDDPAEYVRVLDRSMLFETVAVTGEDLERAEQYRVEAERRTLQAAASTIEDYWISLEMLADVDPISPTELPRVEQLLAKTNQFNLTTRRHSRHDVQRILDELRSVGLVARLRDRFGDYGLTSVVLAAPWDRDARYLYIDTWLMSCRVIGRTFEQLIFNTLCGRAESLEYDGLVGEYLPTKKNALVAELYHRLGFTLLERQPTGAAIYKLERNEFRPATTFVASRVEAP